MAVHQSAHWPAVLVTGLKLSVLIHQDLTDGNQIQPRAQGPSSAAVAAWYSIYWPSPRDVMTDVTQRKT